MRKALLIFLAGLALMALPALAQNVPIYTEQGGASMHVGSGGTLTIDSGGTVTFSVGSGLSIAVTPSFTAGLTVTGAAINLNASSNYAVNVATGTSTGTVTLGGGTGAQAIAIVAGTGDITGTSTDDISITATDDFSLLVGSTDSVMNIATGAFATDLNIGNATGATDVDITGGTGGVTLASTGTGDIRADSADDLFLTIADDATVSVTDALQINATTTTVSGSVVADNTLGIAPTYDTFVQLRPKIAMVALGTMVNGTTQTVKTDIDDDTPAGEWTAVDADTTMSNSTSYVRAGTNSLKMAVLVTATAGDGCTNALASGDQDWTDDESFGMWVFTTTALAAGDLVLRIADASAGGGYTDVNVPACAQLAWTWVEVDVSGVANGNKDAITDLSVVLSAAGEAKAAAGAFDVYMDYQVKWDVGDEEALGYNLIPEGVIGVWTVATLAASANTQAVAVNYTDYFINYQTGNDALIAVTDQSANSGMAVVAYQ